MSTTSTARATGGGVCLIASFGHVVTEDEN